jgi:hypothetical protein
MDVAAQVLSRVLVMESLQQSLEELLESIVSVLHSLDHLLTQVLLELLLTDLVLLIMRQFCWVKDAQRSDEDVPWFLNREGDETAETYLIDLELELFSCQEVVENVKTLSTQLIVTDGDQEVLLHFLKDLQPAFIQLSAQELSAVSTTDHEDVHVFSLEWLILVLNDDVNQGIG